jgi:transcriptional regulator with XRE-family HTH domain
MAVSSISSKIKEVRTALGLNQRGFSKGIFLSQSFYAQIENGTRNPNERTLELVAKTYNVNKDWLKTGKGTMFSSPPPDMELNQLIEIYKELDPLFKEFILQQIKQLLSVQKRNKEKTKKASNSTLSH